MKRQTFSQVLRGTITVVGPGLLDVALTASDGSCDALVSQLAFSDRDRLRITSTFVIDHTGQVSGRKVSLVFLPGREHT
ncbi:MAG TPA: hypothetical protein VGV90_07180 [Solirubrobacteraceae bacterium]|nr:hypothetical protein [Solirubrobacteraceae bacterium]